MNLAEFLRYRGLVATAVGAGVVLGAAGIFLYHQLYAERRRMMLQRELARLDITVAEMRTELNSLRKQSCCKHVTWKNKNPAPSNDTDLEMRSAIDTASSVDADDLDEFFDFSDDEDGMLLLSEDSRELQLSKTDPTLLQLYSNVDQLLKGDTEEKKSALSLLQEYEHQYPDCVGLLWRLAKACHSVAMANESKNDSERRKELILKGCSYAQKALELDDTNCEAHKWFAVTVGSRGEFMSIREKIVDGFVFKQHVDKALSLNPTDPSLHHLSGRFKYEVAALSWIERTVARKIFSNFPTATYQQALDDFLQAEELSPVPWKENQLLIAKCYINQSETETAVSWLQRAAAIPVALPEACWSSCLFTNKPEKTNKYIILMVNNKLNKKCINITLRAPVN